VHGRHLGEVPGAEEDGVLVSEGRGAGAVERVGDEAGRGQRGGEEGRGHLCRLGPPLLLREAALGAVGAAEAVVGLLGGRCELGPGLVAAVDAVLAEGVEEGGALLEVG